MKNEIGTRYEGDWYATIDGQRLPVGHSTNTDERNNQYFDASDGRPSPRWKRWIEDVRVAGRMVIQKSKLGPEMDSKGNLRVHCVGYLGLFKVTDVELSKAGVFSCKIEKIGDVA